MRFEKYDDHLALGRGDLPLEEVVLALHDIRFNGPMILEVKDIGELGTSLQLLKELSHT
jgi:sugar phosphate isomerase/epimerase